MKIYVYDQEIYTIQTLWQRIENITNLIQNQPKIFLKVDEFFLIESENGLTEVKWGYFENVFNYYLGN